jgi:hypothetical protein
LFVAYVFFAQGNQFARWRAREQLTNFYAASINTSLTAEQRGNWSRAGRIVA